MAHPNLAANPFANMLYNQGSAPGSFDMAAMNLSNMFKAQRPQFQFNMNQPEGAGGGGAPQSPAPYLPPVQREGGAGGERMSGGGPGGAGRMGSGGMYDAARSLNRTAAPMQSKLSTSSQPGCSDLYSKSFQEGIGMGEEGSYGGWDLAGDAFSTLTGGPIGLAVKKLTSPLMDAVGGMFGGGGTEGYDKVMADQAASYAERGLVDPKTGEITSWGPKNEHIKALEKIIQRQMGIAAAPSTPDEVAAQTNPFSAPRGAYAPNTNVQQQAAATAATSAQQRQKVMAGKVEQQTANQRAAAAVAEANAAARVRGGRGATGPSGRNAGLDRAARDATRDRNDRAGTGNRQGGFSGRSGR